MARSVSDATRFTPTVPFAHSKTSLRSTTVDFSGSSSATGSGSGPSSTLGFTATPPPPGETPQEKVARLRALAQKAKLQNVSTMDKVVTTGRRWADRAHRITTFSLIGFTGFAFILTIVGAGQLVYYSRQRKAEWLLQQQLREIKELGIALEAKEKGTATQEQILLINQSLARKAAEAEKAEKKKKGMFGSVKEALFSGLSMEEKGAPAAGSGTVSGSSGMSDDGSATIASVQIAPPVEKPTVVPVEPVVGKDVQPPKQSKSWYQWITRQ